MIEIDIDGEWGITSNKWQYFLGHWAKRENEDGEVIDYVKKEKSFRTLKSLMNTYLRQRVRTEGQIKSFVELQNKISEVKEIIEGIADELDVDYRE